MPNPEPLRPGKYTDVVKLIGTYPWRIGMGPFIKVWLWIRKDDTGVKDSCIANKMPTIYF